MARDVEMNKYKYDKAEKARRSILKAVLDIWDSISEIAESDHAPAAPKTFTFPAFIPFIHLETEEYLTTMFGESLRSHSLHQTATSAIERWEESLAAFATNSIPIPVPLCHHDIMHKAATKTCCKYPAELFAEL
jgi:hypothetical protein